MWNLVTVGRVKVVFRAFEVGEEEDDEQSQRF
jgi:hypothetical protein